MTLMSLLNKLTDKLYRKVEEFLVSFFCSFISLVVLPLLPVGGGYIIPLLFSILIGVISYIFNIRTSFKVFSFIMAINLLIQIPYSYYYSKSPLPPLFPIVVSEIFMIISYALSSDSPLSAFIGMLSGSILLLPYGVFFATPLLLISPLIEKRITSIVVELSSVFAIYFPFVALENIMNNISVQGFNFNIYVLSIINSANYGNSWLGAQSPYNFTLYLLPPSQNIFNSIQNFLSTRFIISSNAPSSFLEFAVKSFGTFVGLISSLIGIFISSFLLLYLTKLIPKRNFLNYYNVFAIIFKYSKLEEIIATVGLYVIAVLLLSLVSQPLGFYIQPEISSPSPPYLISILFSLFLSVIISHRNNYFELAEELNRMRNSIYNKVNEVEREYENLVNKYNPYSSELDFIKLNLDLGSKIVERVKRNMERAKEEDNISQLMQYYESAEKAKNDIMNLDIQNIVKLKDLIRRISESIEYSLDVLSKYKVYFNEYKKVSLTDDPKSLISSYNYLKEFESKIFSIITTKHNEAIEALSRLYPNEIPKAESIEAKNYNPGYLSIFISSTFSVYNEKFMKSLKDLTEFAREKMNIQLEVRTYLDSPDLVESIISKIKIILDKNIKYIKIYESYLNELAKFSSYLEFNSMNLIKLVSELPKEVEEWRGEDQLRKVIESVMDLDRKLYNYLREDINFMKLVRIHDQIKKIIDELLERKGGEIRAEDVGISEKYAYKLFKFLAATYPQEYSFDSNNKILKRRFT
jgi:hypothetical protein